MSKYFQQRTFGATKAIFFVITIFLISDTLLLWSWNTLAADLFQLPEAGFKHAFAFGILIIGAFFFCVFVARYAAGSSRLFIHREADES